MSDEKKKPQYQVEIFTAPDDIKTIKKSYVSEQLDKDEALNASDWRIKKYSQTQLQELVDDSTILPQCINAYGNNIAGFGISLKYNSDYDEETEEMKAEWSKAEEILNLMNQDEDISKIFANVIRDRETIGIAYIEVIRNNVGEVVQIEHIAEPQSVEMTVGLEPYIEYNYIYKGKDIKRRKKFKKYKQTIGGNVVYFKEFGDPRILNKNTGAYVNSLEDELTANELIEFKIGALPYGKVRWIGQTISVDGARRAELLNNNYFRKGRHTPMMIIIKGGCLTEDSKTKLQEYMKNVEGENGQHGFLVLEAENYDKPIPGFENDEKKPEIEIKDLASILQKDELFQEYLNNSRRKTQSAFLLPDLYVGYTTDFNRATAQTAMEVTEKQVFQPEREALAWIVNNKLLNGYGFKYVEVQFNAPDITNPDDIANILNVTNAAGGLTLNVAKDLTNKTLGREAEPYPDSIGNLPLALINTQLNTEELLEGINKALVKADENKDDMIIPVLKEIRKALKENRSE